MSLIPQKQVAWNFDVIAAEELAVTLVRVACGLVSLLTAADIVLFPEFAQVTLFLPVGCSLKCV